MSRALNAPSERGTLSVGRAIRAAVPVAAPTEDREPRSGSRNRTQAVTRRDSRPGRTVEIGYPLVQPLAITRFGSTAANGSPEHRTRAGLFAAE